MAVAMKCDADNWSEMMRLYERERELQGQLVDARDRGMITLVRDAEMNTTSASYPAEPPSEAGAGDAGDDDDDDVDPAFLDLFVQDPTLRTSLRDRLRDIDIEHDERRSNYFNMGFPQYNEIRHIHPSRGDEDE